MKPTLAISVHSTYFTQIRSGKKTVEGRTCTLKYAHLQEGDLLQIVDSQDESKSVLATITKLTRYLSFYSMLQAEGIENCLPGILSLEEGVKIYRSFPNYEKQEADYGVLAIKIITKENPSCRL